MVTNYSSFRILLNLNNLFQENKEINCHLTRNVVKEGLYIPQIQTKSYGSKSLKYTAAVLWNNHLKHDDIINNYTKIDT